MIAAIVARNIRYPQDVNIIIIWQPSQRARSRSVESGTSTRQSVYCEHSSPKLTNHILLRVGRHGMRYAAAAPRKLGLLGERHRRFHGAAARRAASSAAARPRGRSSVSWAVRSLRTARPCPAVGHSEECVQSWNAADREKGIRAARGPNDTFSQGVRWRDPDLEQHMWLVKFRRSPIFENL